MDDRIDAAAAQYVEQQRGIADIASDLDHRPWWDRGARAVPGIVQSQNRRLGLQEPPRDPSTQQAGRSRDENRSAGPGVAFAVALALYRHVAHGAVRSAQSARR